MHKWIGVAGALSGVCLCGGVAFLTSHRSPPISEVGREIAKREGLSIEDYMSLARLTGVHNVEMSDSDWALTSRVAAHGTREAGDQALVATSSLPTYTVHRTEAIALAKGFLEVHHTEGWVAPVLVLRKMQDPSWKSVISEMERDPDSGNRELADELLAQK